jgi:small multidrug resistance family-3 protein
VTARSVALFIAAAIAEIGGAYLVWVGIKDHKGIAFVALGAMALTAYGVIAAFQPSHEFGRVLAAYGGVFIIGSLLWASPSTASDPTAPTCSAQRSASSASP